MIYFVSHFESIPGRNAERLIAQILPILRWNLSCISQLPQARFVVICNDDSFNLLEPFLPGSLINRSEIVDGYNDLQILKNSYDSIGMSERLNYGIDFEFKCFERFLLLDALTSKFRINSCVHLDCDLAISYSAAIKIFEFFHSTSLVNSVDERDILGLNDFSTYLSGFTNLSLRKFCKYIIDEYLSPNLLDNSDYRVSDMGAMKSAISSQILIRHSPFDDYDKSFLSPELMSFQPLASSIFTRSSNEVENENARRWWRMDDVSDAEILTVVSDPNFFKFSKNNFQIFRNGSNCYFVHFHGPSKRFIKFQVP